MHLIWQCSLTSWRGEILVINHFKKVHHLNVLKLKKNKQNQPNLDFFNFYYLKEDPKPRTPASSTSTFKKTTFLFSGSFDSCCNGQ